MQLRRKMFTKTLKTVVEENIRCKSVDTKCFGLSPKTCAKSFTPRTKEFWLKTLKEK